MRIAQVFIERPILGCVIAIVISLAGLHSAFRLPIEQYPLIAPPTVQVEASYPGASAQTVENAVVQVIEQQMSGIDGLLYMSSSSTPGDASVQLSFRAGTDPDIAQVQVQDKLQSAVSRLPPQVQQNGLNVSKSTGNRFMVFALVSDDNRYTRADIGDYIGSQLKDPISRINGIGQVEEWGSPYAMHIWLDPGRLQTYRLMPSDISRAVAAQNTDIAAGQLGDVPAVHGQAMNAIITARSRLQTPEQFRAIVLKTRPDGSRVLLGDVARVTLDSEDFSADLRYAGKPASGLGLRLASGANAIEVARQVHALLDARRPSFPAGLTLVFPLETTPFIMASVEEVGITLVVAGVLVVLIMYLFLQNVRATLIPTIAIPVVLLGTFGVLDVLGYSINSLTLFAMVLAIGLLVDDAIVVVENVERIMRERHLPARDATRQSMNEIGGALVAIAAVLSAVLVPMAFFDGSSGVIYRQFSVTMVSAMMLSVIIALTLTPALCATLLKPHAGVEARGMLAALDRYVEVASRRYQSGVAWIVCHRAPALCVYGMLVLSAFGLLAWLPRSFLPEEDQGRLFVSLTLPPGATRERTDRAIAQVKDQLLKQPAVASVLSLSGYSFGGSGQNGALLFVALKPWHERSGSHDSMQAIVDRTRQDLAGIRDARADVIQPATVPGLGGSSGVDMQLVDRGGIGHAALVAARERLLILAAKDPLLADVRYDGMGDTPQLAIDIDDARAGAMNVSSEDINTTLESALGGVYVDDFIDRSRLKRVYMQADARYRMVPENIGAWHVRNASGDMVPFPAFSHSRWTVGPSELDRYNGSSSFEIVGSPASGVSSGVAANEMARLVAQLGPGVGYEWSGQSYQEQLSAAQAPLLYAISALFVFLCLAALYESWAIPFAVLLVVPMGLAGAALATAIRGLAMDVYFQVGLLTTIGLSAKNAILIVEFAAGRERMGDTTHQAVMHAAAIRFRPIVMTSLTFVLGVLPLATGSGAGAAARHSIGTGVVGGTLAGTMLGMFLAPLFYVLVRRFSHHGRELPAAMAGERP